MFAMFDDIYRSNSRETIERVNAYCEETGADWAMTFYDPAQWAKFEDWEKSKTEKTVHLQGIGSRPAKAVKDLNQYGGDVIIWNYGYKSIVLRLIPSDSGKTFSATLKSLDSGKVTTRRLGANRLVAVDV